MEEQTEERPGLDVGRLEKVASRVAAVCVIGGLAGYLLVTGDRAPVGLALGLVGIFALAKLLVLVVGLKERWPAWPAVALELVAIGGVARVVAVGPQGSETVALAVGIALLLGGAALVRRRAVRAAEADSEG